MSSTSSRSRGARVAGLASAFAFALGFAVASSARAQDSRPSPPPAAATPAPAPLAERVGAFLDAAKDEDARRILGELAARRDLDLPTLLRILDAAPLRPAAPRGLRRGLPISPRGAPKPTTYDLFVPEDAPHDAKLPLWIVIHGTSGEGGSVLDEMLPHLKDRRAIVAAPTEVDDLAGKGWGFSDRERELHTGLLDLVAASYPVDRDRVVVCGWSRGGHASFDLAMRRSDRIAAAGPIIGAVPERDFPLLANLHSVRVEATNGGLDQPELVAGVREAERRLKALQYDAGFFVDPKRGHEGFEDRLPAVVERLFSARRDAAPRRLRFACREREYARHYYVRITGFQSGAYRPGQKIVIPGVDAMAEDRRRAAHAEYVEKHTPRLDVDFADGVFRATTRLVEGFDLYVPASFCDPKTPIGVVVDGKAVVKDRRIPAPSPARMLELMREFGGSDPAFRFAEKLHIPAR